MQFALTRGVSLTESIYFLKDYHSLCLDACIYLDKSNLLPKFKTSLVALIGVEILWGESANK